MIAIGPAMDTMKGLQPSLAKFMPEADSELSSMTSTLNGLMVDSISNESFGLESDVASEETEKILQEASVVAEQQTGDKFPSVPSLDELTAPTTTTSTY